jgi:hypothetical protein
MVDWRRTLFVLTPFISFVLVIVFFKNSVLGPIAFVALLVSVIAVILAG